MTMVVGRAWNFVKRHKGKFILGAVVAGGSYAAWKALSRKLEDQLLKVLMKELTDIQPGDDAEKRRERFLKKQEIADVHARKKLPALRDRQSERFRDAALSAALREAKDRAAKLEAFTALQAECFAKALAALYTLHALLLLNRVGFNIAAREVEAVGPDNVNSEVHEEFLSALSHLEGDGAQQIAETLRKVARTCAERLSIAPQTKVTKEEVEKLLKEACREADAELLTGPKGAALLLPDGLEAKVPTASREAVKRLLDEARDYVESPQFLQVFRSSTEMACAALATNVCEEATTASGEGPWPVAKLFGTLTKLSSVMLDADDETADLSGISCLKRFAEEQCVVQLCEGVFGLREEEKA